MGGEEKGGSCPDYAFVNVTSRFMKDYYNGTLTDELMQQGIDAIVNDTKAHLEVRQ